MEKMLTRLERRFGRFAIPGLMRYVCILYIVGLVLNFFAPNIYYSYLSLNPYYILHGQIWRLVTFLVQSPNDSIIFFIFTLYLYYMVGETLENMWGSFRFNVYYFSGVLFTIIGSFLVFFLTGHVYWMDSYYINMSLFLAFAFLFPDTKMLLMFIIPIKIKWLAYLDIALFAYEIIVGGWGTRISIIVALLNFVIFYFSLRKIRAPRGQTRRRTKYKKAVNSTLNSKKGYKHRCCVCGRTDVTNPELEFRYCSKCNGNYEYCQDHLFNHKHVQ